MNTYHNKYLKYKPQYLGGSFTRNKLRQIDSMYQDRSLRQSIYSLFYSGIETNSDNDSLLDGDLDSEQDSEQDTLFNREINTDNPKWIAKESKIYSFFNSCRVIVCFYTICYLLTKPFQDEQRFLYYFEKVSNLDFIRGHLAKTNLDGYKTLKDKLTNGISIWGIFFENPDNPLYITPLHYFFVLKFSKNTYIRQAWATSGKDGLSTGVEMMPSRMNLKNLAFLTRKRTDYVKWIKEIFGVYDKDAENKGPFTIYWIDETMIRHSLGII